VTSRGTPSQSAALPNTPAPEAADATETAARPSATSESVARPAVKKTTPSTTLAAKRSTVLPAAEAASDSVAPSAAEGVIVPPKLIKSVRAVASLDALRDFETGNVVIDAVVGTTGEVESTNVLTGPPSLRGSAVETLKQYRYEPATQNGQPVPAHVTVTIHFRFEK
jgi:TonB family protein